MASKDLLEMNNDEGSKSNHLKGVYPILVTPFDEQERLDLESFEKIINFMVEAGVNGITVMGVLGESNRVVDPEREKLIQTAIRVASGRIQVCVGTSHTGTDSTRALSKMAEDLGASSLLIAPPREPVPNEDRIFEFYQRVAEGVKIPIVVQDHPASTLVHLSVPLLLKMVEEIPNVQCIKQEAPPTPQKITALLKGMKKRKVTFLQGLGALYGIFDLERGAHGFMTGFAFPEVLIAIVNAFQEGKIDEAWSLYHQYLPLIVFEQQPGLAIRKEIYRLRGLIKSSRVRHPGATIDPTTAAQLKKLIDRSFPGVDITKPIQNERIATLSHI